MKAVIVKNIRKDNGMPMTKAEVCNQLLIASLQSGYRYTDRVEECYDKMVKAGIYQEETVEI